VTIDVSMMGRSCTRLMTPGELVLLDGRETDSIPLRWGWSVLEPATVAVLDDRLRRSAVAGRR